MAYNGWANYETWNVALWIDNDYGLYQTRCEMAQDAYDNADGEMDKAKRNLADAIQEMIEEMNPLSSDASLFSDLLGAALGEVDWYEIAENFLEDVEKKVEEEEEEPEVEEVTPDEN